MASLILLVLLSAAVQGSEYFRIACIDGETGNGVPLVLIRTGNYLEYYSDSAGNIAFMEPGMMEQPVFFSVLADGYNFTGGQQYPAPYNSGVVLTTHAGGSALIVLNRTQPAQRVYRLTGAGLYRDSLLVGAPIPASVRSRAAAEVSTGSFGQDTVMVANYKGRVFWVWGDTVCPRSARQNNCEQTGMYSVGATSCLPSASNPACSAADPPSLEYFASESPAGFHHPRPLAPFPPMNENTWLSGLVVLDSGTANETLYAFYYKNPGDGMDTLAQQGLARWVDGQRQFESISLWPQNQSWTLDKTVQVLSPEDRDGGFVYYAANGIFARVPATHSAMANASAFELLDSWAKVPAEWGSGSVNWNAYVQRYLYLGAGNGLFVGFSHSLHGPWANGTRVANHDASGSSCYNPLHMPHLDQDGGRIITFACTYTAMWSNSLPPSAWTSCLFGLNSRQNCAPVVPRYEYNNLMYRVDLSTIM
jgi:hypothetical protein